ncbi:toprim domain-containing protein [Cellulophaga baltica]|uniref:toprim domain-containing protein n=1 Tax=Cellulophaga TaxID=104264 RepID=UPI001C0724FC|nr:MULTISPECIES: toprim domain-containing protein [Cellulophaga]MBU2997563.1 toprim domain-containing protein [Cellulophaga baltica]MDO6768958.1 toprim domain-containing protein [Cellulophaga sp. 1_MG-2023]
MNCKKAKQIDLVSYLKKQGFRTGKTYTKEVWFYSPFRSNEKTPSFKVDINKNIWYDFGEGAGGTIIDFLTKYINCSIKESLVILSEGSFSFHQQKKQVIIEPEPTYSIEKVTELTNQNLLNYLMSRKIDLQFAKRFCFQVHYSFSNGKENYGVAFMNDVGGFEIRHEFFKGCLGSKEITTINNSSDVVSIFEAWFDFLSYLTLKKEIPKENFIILNSTSMVGKAIALFDNYIEIKLMLDNDDAGNRATDIIEKSVNIKITDNRIHYKNYNDLNEFLMNQK